MSLKDIWNNIINFDLNKLAPNLSEVDLVFPVVLLSWMGFLFYMSRYIPESWEKTIISNEGLIGTHYWKKASDYFRSFEKAKEQGLTYNDEIYVSLTFNPLIEEGKIVKDFKLKQSEKQNVVGDVPSLSLYEDRL